MVTESAAGMRIKMIRLSSNVLSGMNLEMLCGKKVAWYSESAAGTRMLRIRVSTIVLSGMNLEMLCGQRSRDTLNQLLVREY